MRSLSQRSITEISPPLQPRQISMSLALLLNPHHPHIAVRVEITLMAAAVAQVVFLAAGAKERYCEEGSDTNRSAHTKALPMYATSARNTATLVDPKSQK